MSEDLLVDGYDYNPHTYMVEVPYNDYFDMKDKCKENKQLKDQLQQKENIIKEVREYIEEHTENVELNIYGMPPVIKSFRGNTQTLLEILDKENK